MDSDRDCKALIFRIGAQICALPLGQVVETLRAPTLRAAPGAPPCVLGLALIRGVALPVIAVANLLGQKHTSGERLIVARAGDRRVGLSVDAVTGIRDIAADLLWGLPPLLRDADPLGIDRVAKLDSELIVLLNAARLAPLDWQSPIEETQAA